MKLLLIFLTITPIIVQAEGMSMPNRTISSYNTESPKGEPVTCFPQTQVQSWKKRKKAVPKVEIKEVIVEKIVTERIEIPAYKNRARLLVGSGPRDNRVVEKAGYIALEETQNFIFGVGYDRLLTKHWSLGGAIFNNQSYLLNVGYDF